MTNSEFVVGGYYTIYTVTGRDAIFGEVLAVTETAVKVRGYSKVPSRWVSISSISSAHQANVSRLMNVYGK